jgi:3',5'-cyclic AMP phosphodiesterase CpdA
MKRTRRDFLKTAGATVALGGLGCERQDSGLSYIVDETVLASRQPATHTVHDALFRPTSRGCTIHWMPKNPSDVRIFAGTSPDALKEVANRPESGPDSFEITGFLADSNCFIQLAHRLPHESQWKQRPVRRFRTARAAGGSFKVAIMADTHTNATVNKPGAADCARRTADAVIADQPDFVVFIGDEASMIRAIYRGRQVDDVAARRTWAEWRALYADLLSSIPSCLVLGNHEGEAGYYQEYLQPKGVLHLQRTATIARKQHLLNPLPNTYPEGGEDEGWVGDPASPATGGGDQGNRSPLENYFAWTWGDALFIVLDVHRYTNPGGLTPRAPEEWTLGKAQLDWFEKTLAASNAKWKIVLCHHLVGGWGYDSAGRSKNSDYYYGRGGGKYARVGEQARVNDLMKKYGSKFFLYGHDHVFAHQPADDIEFVCCGRPSYLNPDWFDRAGWLEAYGDVNKRDPHDFIAALGYTRLTIGPDEFKLDYVRTAVDPGAGENIDTPIGEVAYSVAFA